MTSRVLLFSLLLLIVSSCATHYGTVQGTQIEPSKEGVTYKDRVYGYASCEYVFFIGGMGKQGLADQAMTNLQMSVSLEDGEYLDNFTINHKKLYLAPLYIRHEVLISADRIQSMDSFPIRYDSLYGEHLGSNSILSRLPFSTNDDIYVMKRSRSPNPKSGVVVQPGTDDSKVLMSGNYGGAEVSSVDNSTIFRRNNTNSLHSFLGFKEGDSIVYQPGEKNVKQYLSGGLLGSNGSHILVNNGSGIETIHKNRVILEEQSVSRDAQLNQIMLVLLMQAAKNERLVYKVGPNHFKEGILQKVQEGSVLLQTESEETIEVPISDIFTKRNWLIQNTHKYSHKKFYQYKDVSYFKDPDSVPVKSKIIGFRYYNVLIELENGGMKVVPIGNLFY